MVRWHHPSCQIPSITLTEDGWPRCVSCDHACPSLVELCATQAVDGSSSLTVPPNERQGRMSLYWPSCVHYNYTSSDAGFLHGDGRPQTPQVTHTARRPIVVDSVYGTTLKATEFRIACLAAPESKEHPVHVSLETYSDNSHPEYETVSYLWGGEDGNNSLCRPIFIGPHWDVLLQTENCWSMLRFIRPQRGERLVWVDALCINQQNLEERAIQVAKMRQIYQQCSRVIAYLGDDIVVQSKSFPQFRPLHELHKASKAHELFPANHPRHTAFFGLKELLSRKYFTRVWIVQELLLPERVVFRIGETDFRTDATIMSRITDHHLKSPTWWSETAAPWVQYIAQRSISGQKTFCAIFEVLRFIRRAHASDPRDRLFGVVALLNDKNIQKHFAPDYSISYQHLCIGLFAHWILNQKAYGLLYKARTIARAGDCTPSWLPVCNSSSAWNDILEPDLARWPYHCTHDFQEFVNDDKSLQDRISLAASEILEHEPDAFRICSLASTEYDQVAWAKTWHQDSYIDAFTGALSINLIHLFKFGKQPRLLKKHETAHFIYAVDEGHEIGSSNLYITSDIRLDKIIQPDRDHLFMIDGRQRISDNAKRHEYTENRLLFLILRSDPTNPGPVPRFRLLAADAFLFEALHVGQASTTKLKRCHTISFDWRSGTSMRGEELGLPEIIPTYSVAATIQSGRMQLYAQLNWDRDAYNWWKLPTFPSSAERPEYYEAMLNLCQAMSVNGSEQRKRLLEVILRSNHAREIDGYVVVNIHRLDYATHKRHFYFLPPPQLYRKNFKFLHADFRDWYESCFLYMNGVDWQWTWSGSQNWVLGVSPELSNSRVPEAASDIIIRASTDQIIDSLASSLEFLMEYLRVVRVSYDPPLDLRTAYEMVKRGPAEEQWYIGVPKLFGGVEMDGSMYRVEIL